MRLFASLATAVALAFSPAPLLAQENAPDEPVWAFEESDIPVDPAFQFGVLENGMRYILRQNSTPEGTALVRLHIGSGSLDETESERGLAHFVEHMAFNGSKRIPEGEMIALLEREGLAFGADTNASTGFEQTLYMLNLPRNDEDLLETALMLMRETASELLIKQEAVDRERGIILAERRDRNNFAFQAAVDGFEFSAPDARFVQRVPIGTLEVLENADAEDLRGFYERTYVPENAVLVIVGDYPVELLRERLEHWFADWQGGAEPADPVTGPVEIARTNETDIYVDQALNETVSVTRYAPWVERKDTVANRQQNLLRQVGYGIINRRLTTLARAEDAPFRAARFGTGDLFEEARSTNLTVTTSDGEWRSGIIAAGTELRKALQYGFSEAEVAEQIARLRTSIENSARSANTRSNGALTSAALGLVQGDNVPSTPESSLERFEKFVDQITPETAFAAVLADTAELTDPLIRYQGRTEPEGSADGLTSAWAEVEAAEINPPEFVEMAEFAYQDFGTPGEIVFDEAEERLGIRKIRFANGVMLNLKQTDINEDRIQFRLRLDGGNLLNTKDAPLTTALVSSLAGGGLGEHSQDELVSILAGRSVRFAVSSANNGFQMSGTTTPRDLLLQMQLLTAGITDPGYRPEAVERFRRGVAQFFASLDATPGQALGNNIGAILSDGDPRFSLQSEEAYDALSFEQLRKDISDRFANGAIEIAVVGDFDQQEAIDAVAATIGALPKRETEFQPREEARERTFTADRETRTITHSGEPDQALIRIVWPTTDDSNHAENIRLSLLARVVQIRLQEVLREELGQAYSPGANSSLSRTWRGYGTFNINVAVDYEQLDAANSAIMEMIAGLREGVELDTVDRARAPLLERYDNLLKTLGGWMSLVDNAQSEAERLERYFNAPVMINAVTPDDVRDAARTYLSPQDAVRIQVVPEQTTAE
ncbi:MAG: insulinase family protein [Altererythrobacter sp.]|nr:insulinase family protein [Altererythrobacter sp.]